MLIAGMSQGDFYICARTTTSPARSTIVRIPGRQKISPAIVPALSRWHPDYKDAFEAFLRE